MSARRPETQPRRAPRALTHGTLLLPALLLALSAGGCALDTSRLTPAMRGRLESESILRRADNLRVRFTRTGGRRDRWEETTASIVVTRRTVLIHVNDRTLLEIVPDHSGDFRVRRDEDRLSIHVERGRSSGSWSFHPPGDARGWAHDLRAVLHAPPGGAGDESR
jgi:hypothetical protein